MTRFCRRATRTRTRSWVGRARGRRRRPSVKTRPPAGAAAALRGRARTNDARPKEDFVALHRLRRRRLRTTANPGRRGRTGRNARHLQRLHPATMSEALQELVRRTGRRPGRGLLLPARLLRVLRTKTTEAAIGPSGRLNASRRRQSKRGNRTTRGRMSETEQVSEPYLGVDVYFNHWDTIL